MKLLVFASLVAYASGFAINIDAHDTECFFDVVKAGTKMGLTFQVAEGGFLDIDVTIRGPDERVIHSSQRESDGKFTFSAHADGKYTYCFSNEMSSVTPKLVVFSMYIEGDSVVAETMGDESTKHDKIHDMVNELAEAIVAIRREQEYMVVRERTHRMINDSTNARVVWWSFFEALVLVVMSVGQVYYINRFFEVRSTV